MTLDEKAARVAIIGAGPAGLFAAKQLAENGIDSVLLNRDIKPGGLAEYGIYPEKTRLKDGLRAQFDEILHNPHIYYYGNTLVREDFPLTLFGLKQLGFGAVLIAAGAQGTKRLGLKGEDCPGVYHAKELVYHYNHLPPYATRSFPIGEKVIVVGVGNVMTDVVRYLLTLPQVREITTVARRGLAEVKFDKKELAPIVYELDEADFDTEVARISPVMTAIGQDPAEARSVIDAVYCSAVQVSAQPKWRLRFLYSLFAILCENGVLNGVRLEENSLEQTLVGTKTRGTGKFVELPADTLIFAIGDQVDDQLGLPVSHYHFPLDEDPKFPVGGVTYELKGSTTPGGSLEGVFTCGWSRNASAGMVGMARKDGVNAARAIQAYLSDHGAMGAVTIDQLQVSLTQAGYVYVTTESLLKLEAAEKDQARKLNLVEYKFDSNEEMLRIMGLLG
jgi:ferredoxin/flavodoxin---NADP+ reductase